MDETFVGLDKGSLYNIEKVIDRYLPNTTILAVDHHADDNNYDGFYDFDAHFEHGTVTIGQINPKFYEHHLD
jgi:hypothetical protein